MPIHVTEDTFAVEVLGAAQPVLVDFWAEWCPPCHQIAPILDELAEELAGQLTIAKVDADLNPNTAMAYGVFGLPTLLLFKDGEVVERIVGFRPKSAVLKQVLPYLEVGSVTV